MTRSSPVDVVIFVWDEEHSSREPFLLETMEIQARLGRVAVVGGFVFVSVRVHFGKNGFFHRNGYANRTCARVRKLGN